MHYSTEKKRKKYRFLNPALSCILTSFMLGLGLTACQPAPSKTPLQSRPAPTHKAVTRASSPRMSPDGVQDIQWRMVRIKGQQAKFFNQVPFLRFNSSVNTVTGHTGCNPLFGRYDINAAQRILNMTTKAGHQSCDRALAQEADLADALERVSRFQLNNHQLYLQDGNGQVLIQAEKN